MLIYDLTLKLSHSIPSFIKSNFNYEVFKLHKIKISKITKI